METGVLIALGFAIAIIFLAILLTRLFSRRNSRSHDLNGRASDATDAATWAGINQARRDLDSD